MVTTPNYDLDIDTTLGGSSASDYVIPSQKAIKTYVDNNGGGGGGGTVDQTYDGTSANAQSGVAIAGAGFLTSSALSGYLQNTATGTGALTLLGTATNKQNAINIGTNSSATNDATVVIGADAKSAYTNSVAIGYKADANDTQSIAIGHNSKTNYSQAVAIGVSSQATASASVAIGGSSKASANTANAFGYSSEATGAGATTLGYSAKASAVYAIQLGKGTNSTASSLAVGFNGTNYSLLDGTTGLIPDARISSNIQRTLVSGTNIKTINNTSLLGSGNIDISGGGGDIFYAEYEVTPYADIVSAVQDGKLVYLKYVDSELGEYSYVPLYFLSEDGGYAEFQETDIVNGALNGIGVLDDDTWGSETFNCASTDLSNLSAAGKKVIDGQWVSSNQTIISSSTNLYNSSGTALGYRINLPDDNCKYEVLVTGRCITATTSGHFSVLQVRGNEDTYAPYLCGCRTRTSNYVDAWGSAIIVCSYTAVGTNNVFVYRTTNSNGNGTCENLEVLAYRRIGSNT